MAADDSAAREAGWYRDLLNGAGKARVLGRDLRDAMAELLRRRATTEGMWQRAGEEAGALPEEPTVDQVHLNKSHLLRGSDVQVSWRGLTPPGATVTVIAPDGNEHRDVRGGSIALRIDGSGPITLRLDNRGRIADVRAGAVECFELPAFTIPRVLPEVSYPQVPPVHIPAHAVAALEVPVPRLAVGSAAQLVRQVRDTEPAIDGATARIAGILTRAGADVSGRLRRAVDAVKATSPRSESGRGSRH